MKLETPKGKLTIRHRQMRGVWQCFAGRNYITGASGDNPGQALEELCSQYDVAPGLDVIVHGCSERATLTTHLSLEPQWINPHTPHLSPGRGIFTPTAPVYSSRLGRITANAVVVRFSCEKPHPKRRIYPSILHLLAQTWPKQSKLLWQSLLARILDCPHHSYYPTNP